MQLNQQDVPLFKKLRQFSNEKPISFHVPGHKNGEVFPRMAKDYFSSILSIDLTELPGLDDLHAPEGVIAEAEQLAADYFQSDHTFFLVGGSTVGNLAMILATCSQGDEILVQRNSHKSIMNGLELSGAKPIYMSPEYDKKVGRFTAPSVATVKQAIQDYPNVKAIVLTYPDYFGKTYPIEEIIHIAHQNQIAVLVDEAHGVHFSLGDPFPTSSLDLGADIVVQSAHKMAPAMTMASYLHFKSELISTESIAHYLQLLQSSSPSYPLMASLDLARYFLATMNKEDKVEMLTSAEQLRRLMQLGEHWDVLEADDPLKVTLHTKGPFSGYEIAEAFEEKGIYPELATDQQVLFIHGLQQLEKTTEIKNAIISMNEQLNSTAKHDTIDISKLFPSKIQELAMSFERMKQVPTKRISLQEAEGYIAAEAITPYPPGIPIITKGEWITQQHIEQLQHLVNQGAIIQHRYKNQGIQVYYI